MLTLINISKAPKINFGKEKTMSVKDKDTLMASGGNYYEWSTGKFTPGIGINPQKDTYYYVIITDSNGCKTWSGVQVFLKEVPEIRGKFYLDKNNNGIMDIGEPLMEGYVHSDNSWFNPTDFAKGTFRVKSFIGLNNIIGIGV